jgi:hypothetical protein
MRWDDDINKLSHLRDQLPFDKTIASNRRRSVGSRNGAFHRRELNKVFSTTGQGNGASCVDDNANDLLVSKGFSRSTMKSTDGRSVVDAEGIVVVLVGKLERRRMA